MPPPYEVKLEFKEFNLKYTVFGPNKMLWEYLNINSEDQLNGTMSLIDEYQISNKKLKALLYKFFGKNFSLPALVNYSKFKNFQKCLL